MLLPNLHLIMPLLNMLIMILEAITITMEEVVIEVEEKAEMVVGLVQNSYASCVAKLDTLCR